MAFLQAGRIHQEHPRSMERPRICDTSIRGDQASFRQPFAKNCLQSLTVPTTGNMTSTYFPNPADCLHNPVWRSAFCGNDLSSGLRWKVGIGARWRQPATEHPVGKKCYRVDS